MIGFEFELQGPGKNFPTYAWDDPNQTAEKDKDTFDAKMLSESYKLYKEIEKTKFLQIRSNAKDATSAVTLTQDTNGTVEIVAGPYYYADNKTILKEMGYAREMATFIYEAWRGVGSGIITNKYGCYLSELAAMMKKIVKDINYEIVMGCDLDGKSFDNIYIGETDDNKKPKTKLTIKFKREYDYLFKHLIAPQVTVTWPLNKMELLLQKYFNNLERIDKSKAITQELEKLYDRIQYYDKTYANIIVLYNSIISDKDFPADVDKERLKGLLLLLLLSINYGFNFSCYQWWDGLEKDFTPVLWKSELFKLLGICFTSEEAEKIKNNDKLLALITKEVKSLNYTIPQTTNNHKINISLGVLKSSGLIKAERVILNSNPTVDAVIKSTLNGESGKELRKGYSKNFFYKDKEWKADGLTQVPVYVNSLNGNITEEEFWQNFDPVSIVKGSNDINNIGPVLEMRQIKKLVSIPELPIPGKYLTTDKTSFENYADDFIKWFTESQAKNQTKVI